MDIYPLSPTHGEELINLIKASAPDSIEEPNTQVLEQLISKHDPTDMLEGVEYYLNEGEITSRQQYFWKDGKKVVDTDGVKPNNRIGHSWHKL
ncbi:hypothetical protein PO124_28080 [Bacillus licheniformis]|nr:hypothetical protein [Bacillus licheniformis]